MTVRLPRRTHQARTRTIATLAFGAWVALLSGACEKKPGIEAEKDAQVQPHGQAGAPADLACPAGLPGAALVRIQTGDGNVYCMDQREVSWNEYNAFLGAKAGSVAGQPGECDWNTTFEPEYLDPLDDTPEPYKCPADSLRGPGNAAVSCIDFCDALAYCEWAGKRLCGRVGGSAKWGRVNVAGGDAGGSVYEYDNAAPTTAMEFQYACTQGGKTLYPYGDSYEPARCIDSEMLAANGSQSLAVTDLSTRGCHGSEPPFDQIYDLSGSVSEWQNLCGFSPSLGCYMMGGSTDEYDKTRQACAADIGRFAAQGKVPALGFRCCADGVPTGAAKP